jgi:hypothetical protein
MTTKGISRIPIVYNASGETGEMYMFTRPSAIGEPKLQDALTSSVLKPFANSSDALQSVKFTVFSADGKKKTSVGQLVYGDYIAINNNTKEQWRIEVPAAVKVDTKDKKFLVFPSTHVDRSAIDIGDIMLAQDPFSLTKRLTNPLNESPLAKTINQASAEALWSVAPIKVTRCLQSEGIQLDKKPVECVPAIDVRQSDLVDTTLAGTHRYALTCDDCQKPPPVQVNFIKNPQPEPLLSRNQIIGITVGGVLGSIVLGLLIAMIVMWRKKRSP